MPPEDDEHSRRVVSSSSRTVLERTVVGGDADDDDSAKQQSLKLMMLGCEDHPPYGPEEHTASLLLDVICRALERHLKEKGSLSQQQWHVSIAIYHVEQQDYPASNEEWDSYDGVLLPGSFSSAWATNVEWIDRLKKVLQQEVVKQRRPLLGICFGHQIYAHSFFPDGEAVKCPAGHQMGSRMCVLTREGGELLLQKNDISSSSSSSLQLYYTHGDMVQTLPPCALSLGGNKHVPFQAAAYFESEQQANEWKTSLLNSDTTTAADDSTLPRPTAITFQAHPEYAASLERGVQQTLFAIFAKLEKCGDMKSEDKAALEKDALEQYQAVEDQSLDIIRRVGVLLGWFEKA